MSMMQAEISVQTIIQTFSSAGTAISNTPVASLRILIGIPLLLIACYGAYKALSAPQSAPPWLLGLILLLGIPGFLFIYQGITKLHESEYVSVGSSNRGVAVIPTETAIERLKNNEEVRWLIRLVPYNGKSDIGLSANRLNSLGESKLKFVFVAPYDELKGLKVSDAVSRVGGELYENQWVSAIIFRLKKPDIIFPANARGLIQVINEIGKAESLQNSKSRSEKIVFRNNCIGASVF